MNYLRYANFCYQSIAATYCLCKSQNRFPAGNAGILSAKNLNGFPLSVFCSGHPVELDKPHILALAAETGFFRFKEQFPHNFKNKIVAVQWEWKTSRLI
jgi:hypothetical protein